MIRPRVLRRSRLAHITMTEPNRSLCGVAVTRTPSGAISPHVPGRPVCAKCAEALIDKANRTQRAVWTFPPVA